MNEERGGRERAKRQESERDAHMALDLQEALHHGDSFTVDPIRKGTTAGRLPSDSREMMIEDCVVGKKADIQRPHNWKEMFCLTC